MEEVHQVVIPISSSYKSSESEASRGISITAEGASCAVTSGGWSSGAAFRNPPPCRLILQVVAEMEKGKGV